MVCVTAERFEFKARSVRGEMLSLPAMGKINDVLFLTRAMSQPAPVWCGALPGGCDAILITWMLAAFLMSLTRAGEEDGRGMEAAHPFTQKP